MNSRTPERQWDVFVSYNSEDSDVVETCAAWLDDEGLEPFVDSWRLASGSDSQRGLEDAMAASASAIICFGPHGIGPWQELEMRAAVVLQRSRGMRVIPVLLPGAPAPSEAIPLMLQDQTWCDLRSGLDGDALARLRDGILDRPPGRPARLPPGWLTEECADPSFVELTGLEADATAVYVADHALGQVFKVVDGDIVARAGGLRKPHHLLLHGEHLIVCDTSTNRIVAFDLDLKRIAWTRLRAGGRQFRRPHAITWGTGGGFLVADSDNNRLIPFGGPGPLRRQPIRDPGADGALRLHVPCGLGRSADAIFVANTYEHEILVFDRALRLTSRFGRPGSDDGAFAYPVAVACSRDYVVVSDEQNRRLQVWKVTREGEAWRASLITADALRGHLGGPFGVRFDRRGGLLVADRRQPKILRVDFDRMVRSFERR